MASIKLRRSCGVNDAKMKLSAKDESMKLMDSSDFG